MFGPALGFLSELQLHNDKAWFDAHRDRYERDVRDPVVAFVEAMAPRLAGISPHLVAIAKGAGSSISRINRDTRFSADKSPYKDWIGVHFRHASGKVAPGCHLHISPADTGVGLGVWELESGPLGLVRDRIADPKGGWGPVRDALDAGGFRFIGEALKRVPKPYDAAHPHGEDLKRKTFGAGRPIDPTLDLDDLCDAVEGAYREGWPLMAFLGRALDLPM